MGVSNDFHERLVLRSFSEAGSGLTIFNKPARRFNGLAMKKVLVTGSDGFLGRNLCVALSRCEGIEILRFDVQNTLAELEQQVAQADFIFHLAGVNRPKDEKEFTEGNADLTRSLCGFAEKYKSRAPILLSSSTQAESENAYGVSKRAAEDTLIDYSRRTGVPVLVYRLPNLFGKWSRPNYNSVVSTFCYNVTHDLPIHVNAPEHTVTFAYVDDVVDACLWQALGTGKLGSSTQPPAPNPQNPEPSFSMKYAKPIPFPLAGWPA